jgi:hypothetical protein
LVCGALAPDPLGGGVTLLDRDDSSADRVSASAVAVVADSSSIRMSAPSSGLFGTTGSIAGMDA